MLDYLLTALLLVTPFALEYHAARVAARQQERAHGLRREITRHLRKDAR